MVKLNFKCNVDAKYTLVAKSIIEKEFERANFDFDTAGAVDIYLGSIMDESFRTFIANGYIEKPERAQGYSIKVDKSQDGMTVYICGTDEYGVLYGAVDFCNNYLGRVMWRAGHNEIMKESFFDRFIQKDINLWSKKSSPAVLRRAIWTWGHVIYDYKKFIDNMVMLKLNELVLWNDYAPLNAKDIVSYAHQNGIKVIWGYAWGWDVDCAENDITTEYLEKVQKSVIDKYQKDYCSLGDGIYFQSFTELSKDEINGKCIASVVTDFVNDTSRKLLDIHPDLEIQFGLHATSVKNHLEHFTRLDERVRIVWEDCGAFPYNYDAFCVDDFDRTTEFTDKLLSLRKNEKFGAVLKGQTNLDWRSFTHLTKSDNIGVKDIEFIKERADKKSKLWKIIQSYWLENGDYARRLIKQVSKNEHALLEMLVEDGCFEEYINLSTALCAEFMWDPDRSHLETLGVVSAYPCVKTN